MSETKTKKEGTKTGKTPKRAESCEAKVKTELQPGFVKKTSNSDAKGRVVLGPRHANKMFRVLEQPNGNVLLKPVVTVHEREVWFYKNPNAQAMVQEGIRQSREGKGKWPRTTSSSQGPIGRSTSGTPTRK